MTDRQLDPTSRTTLRRHRERGSHELRVVEDVLDEAMVCHVGFALDGSPWVVPMLHGRAGDQLYLHGAVGNHLLRALASGVQACATATLIDGLVLARSAFHHSANYRSVMVFGEARLVHDHEEKRAALDVLVDRVLPGRAADSRPGSLREMEQTMVVALGITEASAKIRTGPPVDDEDDLDSPFWAGVLPIRLVSGTPVPADDLPAGVEVPDYVRRPRRPGLGD